MGCGVGAWLKTWQDAKPKIRIFGVDGNGVSEELFFIPKSCYKQVDLHKANVCQALSLNNVNEKPFDLVESLEVVEHLEEQYVENFVELLTKFSDVVLLSAVISYQGETDHFNEQLPKYWADLFAKFDYVCFDVLRKEIWNNEKIGFWYRQNLLIYVHKSKKDLFEQKGYKPEVPLYLVRAEYVKYYAERLQKKRIQ